jgi:predicted O-methyltransferase YrrM
MKNQSERLLIAAHGTLTHGADTEREERVLRIGNLASLREKNGKFRKANFERGLLLAGLVEALQPREVLELGTGRGLGAFVMAASALTKQSRHQHHRAKCPAD